MPVFITTDKDPAGDKVRVEHGFRRSDGTVFVLLQRLPPLYAKPPVFLAELSDSRVEIRGAAEGAPVYHKAYAIQDLTEKERAFLIGVKRGSTVLPFLNFSYPNVIRILGKQFRCLDEAELAEVVCRHRWKLIPAKH